MAITDLVRRRGISGIAFAAGPSNLRKPIAANVPSELHRLSGIYAQADRYEVGSAGGAQAGSYSVTVGPFSDYGLRPIHRALGDLAIFRQAGGVAAPGNSVTCVGRKRAARESQSVTVGPFTLETGDRCWVVVQCRDYSSLRYQMSLDFTAVTPPAAGDYFAARIQEAPLTANLLATQPYEYSIDGTLPTAIAVGPSDEIYIGGRYMNELMVGIPITEPDRTPFIFRLSRDGSVAWSKQFRSLGPLLPPGYAVTSLGPTYGQEVSAMAADPLSGDAIAVLQGKCNYSSPLGNRTNQFYSCLMRINSAGIVQAQRLLNAPDDRQFPRFSANAVIVTSDGQVVVAGIGSTAGSVVMVAKINPSDWSVTWKQAVRNTVSSALGVLYLAKAPDGSIYLALREGPGLGAQIGAVVVKFSSAGSVLWQKRLTSSGDLKVDNLKMKTDSEGGLYVYASTISDVFDEGAVLLKLNSAGNTVWQTKGIGIRAYGLAIDSSDRVFLTSGNFVYDAPVVNSGVPARISVFDKLGNYLFGNEFNATDGYERLTQVPLGFAGMGTWHTNLAAGSDFVAWNTLVYQYGYLTPPSSDPYEFYQPMILVIPNDESIAIGAYDIDYTPNTVGSGPYLYSQSKDVNDFVVNASAPVISSATSAYTIEAASEALSCDATSIYTDSAIARSLTAAGETLFPSDLLAAPPYSIGWLSTLSTASNEAHLRVYYRASITQSIYRQDELAASGLTAGSVINSLRWYMIEAIDSGHSIRGLNVRLFHTTSSNAVASSPAVPVGVESKTTVYADGPLVEFTAAETIGEVLVTFSSNFTWNGTNSICVETCTSQNENEYLDSGKMRCTYPGENGTLWFGEDTIAGACSESPVSTFPSRASIRFGVV